MVSTSSDCVCPTQYRTCEDQCDKSSVGQSHVKNSGRPSLNERRSMSFVLRGVEQEDMYIVFICEIHMAVFEGVRSKQKVVEYVKACKIGQE